MQAYCSLPNLRARATSSLPPTSSIYECLNTIYGESEKTCFTFQRSCCLNVVKNSGSGSTAASFSYLSSSASFCERRTSPEPIVGEWISCKMERITTHSNPPKTGQKTPKTSLKLNCSDVARPMKLWTCARPRYEVQAVREFEKRQQ